MAGSTFLTRISLNKQILTIGIISLVSLFLILNQDMGRFLETLSKHTRNEVNVMSIGTTRDNAVKSTEIHMTPSTSDIQEERRSHLRKTCERLGAKRHADMVDGLDEHTLKKMDHIYVLDNYNIMFCYVPKVGCTSWKRMLLTLQGIINPTMDVNQISIHELSMRYLPRLSRLGLQDAKDKLAHYTKTVFVREPFSRMLSAFRDKFEVNGGTIKKTFAPRMVPSARNKNRNINVTFGNFVDYVSSSWNLLESPAEEHWREMYRLCFPCDVPYDFIGHFETLANDSRLILQQITNDDNITFPVSPTHPTNSSNHSIFNQFYSQLTPLQLKSLYKRLETDIEMFDYPVPPFIKTRMNISSPS